MSAYLPTESILGDLTMREVYIAHDGPRLFSCVNRLGTIFLGLFVDEDENDEIYLFVAVSNERFIAVRSGGMPLRAAFTEAHDGFLFEARFGLNEPEEAVRLVPASEIPAEWLPDQDAYLRYDTPTAAALDVSALLIAWMAS